MGWELSADESVEAHLLALVSLPELGPRRLAQLLAVCEGPAHLWHLLRRPRPGGGADPLGGGALGPRTEELLERWARAARSLDPPALWRRHRALGVRLLLRGGPDYPDRLAEDGDAPLVLFVAGDAALLEAAGVAVVGTRRATPYGLGLARRWAQELVEAGVAIVSGLARGIDAAAHDGALAALARDGSLPRPIGVVGTGLDVVYPRSSRSLWAAVKEQGVLVSEAPLGVAAERWRFPARNRIIAGLADAVLVVESHQRGGALGTAMEANERGRPVLAVPGSVHAAASVGTNELIRDGALLAGSVDDVLITLPRRAARANGMVGGREGGHPARAPELSLEEAALLDALGWDPAPLDALVARTGWSLGAICRVVEGLAARRLVMHRGSHIIQVRE